MPCPGRFPARLAGGSCSAVVTADLGKSVDWGQKLQGWCPAKGLFLLGSSPSAHHPTLPHTQNRLFFSHWAFLTSSYMMISYILLMASDTGLVAFISSFVTFLCFFTFGFTPLLCGV